MITQNSILAAFDNRQLTDRECNSKAMAALITSGHVKLNDKQYSLTQKSKQLLRDAAIAGVKLTRESITAAIKNHTISVYHGTFTAEHREFLIRDGYWWLKYKDVNPSVAPAGHLVATGKCHLHNNKRCEGYSSHIYTKHQGEDCVPCCFACWTEIDAD